MTSNENMIKQKSSKLSNILSDDLDVKPFLISSPKSDTSVISNIVNIYAG